MRFNRTQRGGRPGVLRAVAAGACLLAAAGPARAQFLRLGPFDITAQTATELIYTTNVEGERESESENEREDYYVVLSLGLAGAAPFGRGTQVNLDSSFGVEKHFVREDLDSENAPFGRLRLDSRTQAGRYDLGLYGGVEREYAEEENRYVPGGRKKRDITDTVEYGGDLSWSWSKILLKGMYEFSSERHQDEVFQDGDQDETTITFDARWELRKDLRANYTYERTRTEFVSRPDDEAPWETTETITLDWVLPILERPKLTYSLGVERENKDDEKGDWELTHTINLVGEWDVSSPWASLRLSLDASYDYERDPEDEEDIGLTYGGRVEHDISRTAVQSLTFKREPVETLGTTAETDSTTVEYLFRKSDLFIYNLSLTLGVNWSRDEPLDKSSPVEKILEYTAALKHNRALNRKLERQLSYEYSLEDSNLYDEVLEEHRVTLRYVYTF